MPIGSGRTGGIGVKATPGIKGPHKGLPWKSPAYNTRIGDPNRFLNAVQGLVPTAFADARASNATYFASSTFLKTAGVNVARVENDPSTKSVLGLLVEDTATNLFLHSGDMTNTTDWSDGPGGVTRSTDGTLLPDGVTAACKVTNVASSTVHILYNVTPITITSGATYTRTAYVKAGTHNFVNFYFNGPTTHSYVAAVFDISGTSDISASQTSTGLGGVLVSASGKYIGSGWYRLTLVGSITDSTAYTGFGFAPAATGNTFGTGGDLIFTGATSQTLYWGFPQLETGSVGTSFILTTTAATTRAADAYSFTLGASTTDLQFTFDDGSMQSVSGLTPGSTYTIPTNLNRSHILYIDDAASTSISALANQTLNDFTSVGTITLAVLATANQTIAAFTSAGVEALKVLATANETVASFTQTATATVIISASANNTLAAFTTVSADVLKIAASANETVANFTSSATATLSIAATANQTLAAFTSAGAAQLKILATANQTLAGFTSASAAQLIERAAANETVADFTSAAAAVLKLVATSSITVDPMVSLASTQVIVKATANQTVTDFTSVSTATFSKTAIANQLLDDFTQSATSVLRIVAQSNINLDPFTLSAIGVLDEPIDRDIQKPFIIYPDRRRARPYLVRG